MPMSHDQRAGRHTAPYPSHRAKSVMSCNVHGVACATCRVRCTRPTVTYTFGMVTLFPATMTATGAGAMMQSEALLTGERDV
jgi:hypothetical protein